MTVLTTQDLAGVETTERTEQVETLKKHIKALIAKGAPEAEIAAAEDEYDAALIRAQQAESRVRRRGRMIAEVNLQKADEKRQKQNEAADAREKTFLEKAPSIELHWGDLVMRLRLTGGRDGMRRQTLAEAVKRMHQATDRVVTLALGQVRAGEATREDAIAWGAAMLGSALPEETRAAQRICPGAITFETEKATQ